MRPLLTVILLFAAQNSLFATLVYRYELAFQGQVRPQGGPNSGYIDFLTPTGEDVPIFDAVYDLRFTSFGKDGTGIFGNPLPPIPARTYSLTDDCRILGSIAWNETFVTGIWYITFPVVRDENGEFLTYSRISSGDTANFWPLAYAFNESTMNGSWLFTGSRNVPEAGGTALYLTFSAVIFAVFRWRQLNCSR